MLDLSLTIAPTFLKVWLWNNNFQSLKWSFGPHLMHSQAFIKWNHENSKTLGASRITNAIKMSWQDNSLSLSPQFSRKSQGAVFLVFPLWAAEPPSAFGCDRWEGLGRTEWQGRLLAERMRPRAADRLGRDSAQTARSQKQFFAHSRVWIAILNFCNQNLKNGVRWTTLGFAKLPCQIVKLRCIT